MSQKTTPTEAEINDNLKQLAWLAVGFFQALLSGEAKVVIQHAGFRPGQDFTTTTIALEWNKPTTDEAI